MPSSVDGVKVHFAHVRLQSLAQPVANTSHCKSKAYVVPCNTEQSIFDLQTACVAAHSPTYRGMAKAQHLSFIYTELMLCHNNSCDLYDTHDPSDLNDTYDLIDSYDLYDLHGPHTVLCG